MATILDTLITRLGFETDTTGLEKAESGLSDLKSKAVAIAGVVGTVLGGGFLINRIADTADETLKFADSIEVAVEEVSALDFAVQRQGGSVEGLRSSLVNMTGKLGEAARGTGEAKTAMEAYGLTLEKEDGTMKTTTDVLLDLNNAFQDLSRAEQLDLANKFGLDQGTIRLLQTAPDAVGDLLVQARSLGILTRQEATRFAEFNDSITNMGQGLMRLGIDSVTILIQPLTDLFNLIAEGTQFVREHSRFFKILGTTLTIVAGAWALIKTQAIAANIAMFAMPLTIIALIALFALLAEDMIAYFNDQDSLLGDAIKKWPELEGAIGIVGKALEWLKDLTVETFRFWKEDGPGLVDTVKEWLGPLLEVAQALDRILGISKDLREIGRQINPFTGGDPFGGVDIGTGQQKTFGATISDWLKSRVLGVPVGTSFAAATPALTGGLNSTNSVTINKLELNVPGGDSDEIARNVSTSIGAELQNMVQNVDSTIKR